MRFFEKQRPEVYIHTAKLKRDKKTGRRLWQFTLIVTMSAELVESCDVAVAKGWEYITDRDSGAVDVSLASEIAGCAIDFFAAIDDVTPVLHLEGVDLTGLRCTRDKKIVEFWFSGEHENVGGIHEFMKPYAYTRVWAVFKPSQGDLQMPAQQLEMKSVVLEAGKRLAALAREDGTTITLSTAGMEPVVIAGAGANQDDLLEDAIRLVFEEGKATTSLLQRRMRIGYSRACGLLDAMEERGLIGPAMGVGRPRELKKSRIKDPG